MDIHIRKATEKDVKEVQRLSQELFEEEIVRDPALHMQWSLGENGRETFLKRITENDRFCLLAEENGVIIGYAMGSILPVPLWRQVKRLELENIVVTKQYRNAGVGAMLTEKVFALVKELGMDRVMVEVYALNEQGICFYKRMGFVPETLQLEKILTAC